MKAKMKTLNLAFLILVAAFFSLTGCKKADTTPNPTTPGGALAGIRKAFPNPGPDIAPSIDKIAFSLRYGEYQGVLTELDKMSASPNLTPDQKKALDNASEQIKKSMAAPK
jgi:hypothetical protein